MIEQELRRIIRQIVREELEKTRFITVDSARELITELAEELLPGIVAECLEDIKKNRDVIPPPMPTIDQTPRLQRKIDRYRRHTLSEKDRSAFRN